MKTGFSQAATTPSRHPTATASSPLGLTAKDISRLDERGSETATEAAIITALAGSIAKREAPAIRQTRHPSPMLGCGRTATAVGFRRSP